MIWLPLRDRVQSELIKRGYCAGCTKSLSSGIRKPHPTKPVLEVVTCSCQRVYLYDVRINSYRRALIDEVTEPTSDE